MAASVHHTAILTDYAAMEAYKKDAIDSIVSRMRVLAQFPAQVVVLRGTQYVCALRGRKAGLTRRMIYSEATNSFAEFCRYITLAQQGDAWHRKQILERESEAVRQLKLVEESGADITSYYSVFEKQFNEREKKDIRLSKPFSKETLEKFVRLVAMFAGALYDEHPHTGRWPKPFEWPYTFIYRSSILHYLHFFQWIRNGSPKSLNATKVRNDLIDLNFATYATYFDGLMTDDVKLEALYTEACYYLEYLFTPALTRSWEQPK
ncbi:hypothetical protein [Hyphomonas sp.]|uniref:hypothetical protein n=1 Tax=Hyphomonas sp. TaxID=87 RepID=UPI003267CFEA